MKSKILPLLLILCGITWSCSKSTADPVLDTEAIKAEIQTMEDEYAKELNAKNAEGVAAYYADDAISFPSEEKPLHGEKAILEAMAKDIKAVPEGHKITFTTKEIFPSKDGLQVVEVGEYIMTDPRSIKVRSGNFISMFEKRDGKYVCIRDIAAADGPKPMN